MFSILQIFVFAFVARFGWAAGGYITSKLEVEELLLRIMPTDSWTYRTLKKVRGWFGKKEQTNTTTPTSEDVDTDGVREWLKSKVVLSEDKKT